MCMLFSSFLLRKEGVNVCIALFENPLSKPLLIKFWAFIIVKIINFKNLNNDITTFSDGCLGSRNDEERSEMRYVMRIAE